MDFFTGLSDFISAHWGEVVAIIGSSSFIIGVLTFVLKLILIKIQSKNTAKINAPIVAKFNEIKTSVSEMKTQVEKAFTESLTNYTKLLETKLNEIMEKYQEVKKAIYNEVVAGNEEAHKLLAELETKTIEIQTLVEEIKEDEQIETLGYLETIKEEPKEDVKEKVKAENSTEKTENTGDFVVVSKTYGE